MSVWYLTTGKVFDSFLVKSLLEVKTFRTIELISQVEFAKKFRDWYLLSDNFPLDIIVDIGCIDSICLITKTVKKCGRSSKLATFRLIALSDFSTWGERIYDKPIQDFAAEFSYRRSLMCSQSQYSLENSIVDLAEQFEITVCIVGYGIFYGNDGIEMKDIFRYLWDQEVPGERCENLQLACGKVTTVPTTHIANFVSQLTNLILYEGVLPIFVAAIDRPLSGTTHRSFHELVTELDFTLNGIRSTSVLTKCDGCETVDSAHTLWQCSIPSSAVSASDLPSRSLHSGFSEVWAEYLAANALDPVTVLVVGPPRTGKSELAFQIAERLQVELITVESAVKFLFNFAVRDGEENTSASQNSILMAVKAELRVAGETKVNEGKKPAKGAAAPAEGVLIDDSVFTSAFCQSLSVELQRKCISAQALLHPRCQRRGFVLDAWDGRVVTDATTLLESINAVRGEEGVGTPFASVNVLVELHCRAGFPVDRLISSQGAQAKAKESQAAVKALETLVASYNSGLVSISADEDVAGIESAEHMKLSHKGAVEIGACGAAVYRVDLSSSEPCPPWTLAVENIVNLLLTLRGGRIGWLNFTTPAPEDSAGELESTTVPTSDCAVESFDSASELKVALDLSAQIQQLDSVKLTTLTQKADKLQAFLTATVLPQLAEGLVRIQREQPDDPIMFLAEQLAQCSTDRNQHAQDKALGRFLELLHQGEKK